MEKLRLDQVACTSSAGGIGEKNTVSSGPDDGANNCQASHWWNVMRHDSTEVAVNNILGAPVVSFSPKAPEVEAAPGILSTGAANIVGHGNEGLIETGMGQNGAYDNKKIIFSWNEGIWGELFDRFKNSPVTYVSLWACHPGAGPDGAELVYRLARHCDRAVRAGTGFLYCNSEKIWWENGSVWQVGTPNNKPTPISAPSAHALTMTLLFEDNSNIVGVNDLLSIRIENRLGLSNKMDSTIFNDNVALIAERIFCSDPIDLNGVSIPAMVTAKIHLAFKSGNEEIFSVYNDRLAKNDRTGTAYYIGSLKSILGIQ